MIVLFSSAVVLQVLHDRADDIVELRHPGFRYGPAVLRCAPLLVLLRQMRDDMHPGRVEPEEERLAVLPCLVEELERVRQYLVVDRLHAFRAEFARIFDFLFSDLAPARLHGGIVHVRRPTMDHVARTHGGLECRRVVGMAGVLHRVQVIEVAVEFIEAMQRGQELVQVAQMVLAELAGGVAHRLEHGGGRRRFVGHAER